MGGYTYTLYSKDSGLSGEYIREELQELTTIQLREICYKEKIVIGVINKLSREELIETILRFRGARLKFFINSFDIDGIKRISNSLKNQRQFLNNTKIKVTAKINLFLGLDTTFEDNYIVESQGLLNESNALLLNDKGEVVTIFNIKTLNKLLYLTMDRDMLDSNINPANYKNFNILFFDEKSSRQLYNIYYQNASPVNAKLKGYTISIPEIQIHKIYETNTILNIDFGTSYTTAGSYLEENYIPNANLYEFKKNTININQINNIKHINICNRDNEKTELFPTVVSIKNCMIPENIEYRFGYDAMTNARRNAYNNPETVFYNIKTWVTNYEKIEEVSDEAGNTIMVSRKEILQKYMQYIIECSEQQHKCKYKNIHLTSPVKQKSQYLKMYKEIIPEYNVETKNALDEGIAVLYNTISNQIEKKNFEDGVEYRGLIIDCGGGTCDLTSCEYTIEDNNITHKLLIKTTYVNGETNFGGNNITFKIFQYLKILLSNYYKILDFPVNIEYLLGESILDTYRFVDEFGISKVYETLQNIYEYADEIIPTKFNEYKDASIDEYRKIRSNFYFIWNLAEQIKIDFFQKVGVHNTNFNINGLKKDIFDPKIYADESWSLYIVEKGRLLNKTDLPQVIISKEEISVLIKADVYNIIKNFLEPLDKNNELYKYDVIKLTGQTCKIDLFRDALKEYIPGKVIERGQRTNNSIQDLKITCLEGAIKYQNANKIGVIASKIINNAPVTPYKITAFTHTNKEITLIASLEQINQSYGHISRHYETREIEFLLKNSEDTLYHRYIYTINYENFRQTTYEETNKEYSNKIPQDDVDTIVDDEIRIFTYAYEDNWGFYVLPILRKDGILHIGNEDYFPFEDTKWRLDYFDGFK